MTTETAPKSPKQLLTQLLDETAEHQAEFMLYAAGTLSFGNLFFLYATFPMSKALEVILIYNGIIGCCTAIVPFIKNLKIRYAPYTKMAVIHYVGFHAWFLYAIKHTSTPTQLTCITTIVYGITLSAILSFPRPNKWFGLWVGAYVAMPSAAILIDSQDRNLYVWWLLFLIGCIYAVIIRLRNNGVYSDLAKQQHLRQKAEVEAKEQRVKADLLTSKRKESEAAERLTTMAKTAQMLAHDLKKPFTAIDLLLQAIRSERDQNRVRSLIQKFEGELMSSSAEAKGLIVDLIELGSEATPLMEAKPFTPLLRQVLYDVFARYPAAEVSFGIALEHQYQVQIDERRIRRVLTNLIENAIQAMPEQSGQLWVHTHSSKSGQLELSIGNTGKTIPEEDRDKVFDAFFTSGKIDGSGLGLAICKKIVAAHGGAIRIASQGMRTWFHLTLPYAPAAGEEIEDLPAHSQEIRESLSKALPGDEGMQQVRRQETEIEQRIITALTDSDKHLQVAILDTESFYIEAVASQIASFPDLKVAIQLHACTSPEQLYEAMGAHPIDLVICEVDLRPHPEDGYAVTEKVRQSGFRGIVCLHSNLVGNDVYRKSLHAGAQAYLPKPLSRLQMLALLAEALPSSALPEIVVVDDDPFVLECWQTAVTDAKLHVFSSAKDFRLWLKKHPGKLDDLVAAIFDYHLDHDDETGLDLAADVHAKAPKLPIIIASDAYLEDSPDYVRLIGKEPQTWAQLKPFAS